MFFRKVFGLVSENELYNAEKRATVHHEKLHKIKDLIEQSEAISKNPYTLIRDIKNVIYSTAKSK